VVVQQVDFVDVEQAAVGSGQDAGLEVPLAFLDGFFDVEGADDPVFSSGDRQVDKGRGAQLDRQRITAGDALAAVGAPGVGPVGVAAEAAVAPRPLSAAGRQAQAAVDLAVRSPRMSTPPMRGSTAFSTNARFMRSGRRWP
jgi:hypothetical protein